MCKLLKPLIENSTSALNKEMVNLAKIKMSLANRMQKRGGKIEA
jgi:hypothetical protein